MPRPTRRQLTVCTEVVIEQLEQRERVPRVWRLHRQHGVHVDSEQRPEHLRVLHQQVAEPSERLQNNADVTT